MSSTRYPSKGSGVPAADAEYQRRVLCVSGWADRRQPLTAARAILRALAMLYNCVLDRLNIVDTNGVSKRADVFVSRHGLQEKMRLCRGRERQLRPAAASASSKERVKAPGRSVPVGAAKSTERSAGLLGRWWICSVFAEADCAVERCNALKLEI